MADTQFPLSVLGVIRHWSDNQDQLDLYANRKNQFVTIGKGPFSIFARLWRHISGYRKCCDPNTLYRRVNALITELRQMSKDEKAQIHEHIEHLVEKFSKSDARWQSLAKRVFDLTSPQFHAKRYIEEKYFNEKKIQGLLPEEGGLLWITITKELQRLEAENKTPTSEEEAEAIYEKALDQVVETRPNAIKNQVHWTKLARVLMDNGIEKKDLSLLYREIKNNMDVEPSQFRENIETWINSHGSRELQRKYENIKNPFWGTWL